MSNTIEEIYKLADELKIQLDNELGLKEKNEITRCIHKEPEFTKLNNRSIEDIKNLYDEFLLYYDELIDRGILAQNYLNISKFVFDKVELVLTQEASDLDLKNADARKAWVACHEQYLSSEKELLYFRSLRDSIELQTKKVSKSIDRLFRELNSRYYPQDKPKSETYTKRTVQPKLEVKAVPTNSAVKRFLK